MSLYRSGWEQTRLLASCSLMPHTRRPMSPTELLRFEWDQNPKDQETVTPATKMDFKRMLERFGE